MIEELVFSRAKKEANVEAEMENISTKSIKADFVNFLSLQLKISRKREQLYAINSKLTNPHSTVLSNIPKASNPVSNSNKTLYLLQEKNDIVADLKKLEKQLGTQRKILNKLLRELNSAETAQKISRKQEVLTAEESVLRLRYLCGFNWAEINKFFYSEDVDWDTNMESYQRRIFRYHEQAFFDLQKMMKGR